MSNGSDRLKEYILSTTPEHERMLSLTTRAPLLGAIKSLKAQGRFNPDDAADLDAEAEYFAASVTVAMDEATSRRDARLAASMAISLAFIIGLYCGERDPDTAKTMARDLAALAGRKSGNVRRRNAENAWQPHALKLTQDIWKESGKITRDRLVEAIQARWALPKIRAPGETQLKTFIRLKIKSGELCPPLPKNRQ
jgi:hypothetical protein